MSPRSFLISVFKFIAIVVYESLVIAGIMIFVSLLAVLLTPNHQVPPETLWFQLLMLAAVSAYLAGSLKMGGQTLGMKAWKVHWNGLQGFSWLTALLMTAATVTTLLATAIGAYRLFA